MKVGDVGTVATTNGGWIGIAEFTSAMDATPFDSNMFELWQPKVGDRVRVTYGHRWNGEGVVDFVHGGSTNVRMETGEFAGCVGGFAAVFIEPLPVAAEAQPATLKIKAGRYYRTRDGRKVGPMERMVHPVFTWASDDCYYDETGRATHLDISNDVVAEWVDEPAAQPAKPLVAATVDYRADEYGSGVRQAEKPKFKVGDKVRYKDPDYGIATVVRVQTDGRVVVDTHGEWGICTERPDSLELVANDNAPVAQQPVAKFKVGDKVDYLRDRDGQWLGVTIDRVEMTTFGTMGYWGRGRDGHTGLFDDHDIILSRPTTQPTAIVARIDNGQPKPNPVPFVHSTVASAQAEAERLANVHCGKKFGVYVLTGEPAFVDVSKAKTELTVTLRLDASDFNAKLAELKRDIANMEIAAASLGKHAA